MTSLLLDLINQTRKPSTSPVELPETRLAGKDSPTDYLPDARLVDAFRATLLLRRPLFITGEPGTGETQAAHYSTGSSATAKKRCASTPRARRPLATSSTGTT